MTQLPCSGNTAALCLPWEQWLPRLPWEEAALCLPCSCPCISDTLCICCEHKSLLEEAGCGYAGQSTIVASCWLEPIE